MNSEHQVYKTINPDLFEALPLLDANPNLQIVHIQRDPRAVYSSQHETRRWDERKTEHLAEICDMTAANLKVAHPRVHKVNFHDFVTNALEATRDLMNRLKVSMTQAQAIFIEDTFNNQNCLENDFGLCRRNSTNSLHKWKMVLNSDEKHAYDTWESCQTVQRFFGYSN